MNPLFRTTDLATFFIDKNLKIVQERKILTTLINEYPKALSIIYQEESQLFISHVYSDIQLLSMDENDVSQARILLGDSRNIVLNDRIPTTKAEKFERYFKHICLELLFTNMQGYKRLKIRTILSDHGYKRRSPQLNGAIFHALGKVPIIPTAGSTHVDISKFPLDTIISFRLMENFKE